MAGSGALTRLGVLRSESKLTSKSQALALGADAVLLGRPVLWGLTLGGQAGVEQVLRALQSELELAMVRPFSPAIQSFCL